MTFHDTSLPHFISLNALGYAEFNNCLVNTISGREVKIFYQEYAKQKYIIKTCRLSHKQFMEFNNFFRARKGSRFSFRHRDCADHALQRQLIAIGDDKTSQFQLFKTYHDEIAPYKRIITKIAYKTLQAYIDNEPVEVEIDYMKAFITLQNKLPYNSKLIIDAVFDVEVRFNQDSFAYNYLSDNSIEISALELCEV